jgi:acyl-coenzyme A synthetase/AMP-(fatty) acid ligase
VELRRALPHVQIYLMFGQTESCIRSCYLPPEQIDHRPTSIGRAIDGVQVMVLDEDGQDVPPDGVGELVCRGPNVMMGYWNDPQLSDQALRTLPGSSDRALFTGDLVRRDAEGFLYFLGRKDEMIKSGAHRVFPLEVENALVHAPGVREAAVVGVHDAALGQTIVAHIVATNRSDIDPRALLEHCRRVLPAYMVPRRVVFHPELPRTASGKIRKMDLVDPSSESSAS